LSYGVDANELARISATQILEFFDRPERQAAKDRGKKKGTKRLA